jgi:hypothetical protein
MLSELIEAIDDPVVNINIYYSMGCANKYENLL